MGKEPSKFRESPTIVGMPRTALSGRTEISAEMQFIQNGPDIPDRLLQAYEEGKVVFFCGAGISYPAGLPGFQGLVSKLYDSFTTSPTAVEKAAIKNGQFDTAIGLLESRITGGREVVRQAVADILTPTDPTNPKATATHRALIGLSRSKDGRHRLIEF